MSFTALLTSKYEHLCGLTSMLLHEQKILVQGRPDGQLLLQIAADKKPLFETLEQIEVQQSGVLRELGISDPERAAIYSGCMELWHKVQSEARQAARINRLNGTLVEQSMEHNQKALNTLQELAGSTVYDASGKPCSPHQGINSVA